MLASGYALDLPAAGFTGFSFTATAYPGLRELHDRAWEQLKAKLYALFPALAKDDFLKDGSKGLDRIAPGLSLLFDARGGFPDLLTKPFIPFQFHVTAAAAALTRDEFVARSKADANRLWLAALADTTAPAALLVLASDAAEWERLYLKALVDSGLLRADGAAPVARDRVPLVGQLAAFAAGLLGTPAGRAASQVLYLRNHPAQVGGTVPETGDLAAFFALVRKWSGEDPTTLAPVDPSAVGFGPPTFELFPPWRSNANPTPAFPTADQFGVPGAAAATQFDTFRVYVPWVAWGARDSLPADDLISGVTPDGNPQVGPLDLSKYLTAPGAATGAVSLTGPFTAETRGFVPAGQDLPFTVSFQLPLLLVLDPAGGYAGVPLGATGQTPDGKWLVSLAQIVPGGVVLGPGVSTTGRTITVRTPDGRRVEFATGVSAGVGANQPPVFTTPPETAAAAGSPYRYDAAATDPDGSPVFYLLVSAPPGMTVGGTSGAVTWSPTADPNGDPVTYGSPQLPAGATLHPTTGLFERTVGFSQAGTYAVPVVATANGKSTTTTLLVVALNANAAPTFDPVERWRVYEGQEVRFRAFALDPDNPASARRPGWPTAPSRARAPRRPSP